MAPGSDDSTRRLENPPSQQPDRLARQRESSTPKYHPAVPDTMYTPAEFVLELLSNVVELVVIFLQDVALGVDPLTTIAWAAGMAFVLAAVVALGYLALGALAAEVGVTFPGIGKGQAD